MKRKIYNELVKWKNEKEGSTALLIEGARRIGKSYIAEEFARNEYDSYNLIDFSKEYIYAKRGQVPDLSKFPAPFLAVL